MTPNPHEDANHGPSKRNPIIPLVRLDFGVVADAPWRKADWWIYGEEDHGMKKFYASMADLIADSFAVWSDVQIASSWIRFIALAFT